MVKSPWPYRASFIDFEKIEIAEKPPLIEKSITVLDTVNFQDRSQFEKLWKKSLNAFKHKETKSKCTKSSGHRLRRIETKETSASLSNEGKREALRN